MTHVTLMGVHPDSRGEAGLAADLNMCVSFCTWQDEGITTPGGGKAL